MKFSSQSNSIFGFYGQFDKKFMGRFPLDHKNSLSYGLVRMMVCIPLIHRQILQIVKKVVFLADLTPYFDSIFGIYAKFAIRFICRFPLDHKNSLSYGLAKIGGDTYYNTLYIDKFQISNFKCEIFIPT